MSVSYFIPDLAPEDLHRCEEIVRRSRFIVSLAHTPTPEAAKSFIERIKQEFPDATHNCWAYAAGAPGQTSKVGYSDDGEPSGTAGMPVLDAIRKSGIVDVVVVVTRYFGGTLLGTGGLVHTYGASAKQGLIESEIVIRKLCDIVSVKVDYSLLGKMQHEIMTKGYLLEDTVYEDEVTFIISCPIDTTDNVIAEIINMTNAGAVCEKIDKKYVDVKEEEG